MYNTRTIESMPQVLFIQLGQLGNDTMNSVTADPEIIINGTSYAFQSAIHYDGFVMTSGESGGHYRTYTCVDGIWFKFNDSLVAQVDEQTIALDAPKFYIMA